MELKRLFIIRKDALFMVLIVPYGIETCKHIVRPVFVVVLIVPYGIETRALTGSWDQRSIVLIVPYGIETTKTNYSFFIKFVLIVPYGIETIKQVFCQPLQSSVNCTLWN